jgi:hypothetical protein
MLLAMVATLAVTCAHAASPYESAAHALLERVIGTSAAAQVALTLVPATVGANGAAVEDFTIAGTTGAIDIRASTPSALAQGAGWYLKYVAHADLFLRGTRPVLPAALPAPLAPIHRVASVAHRYVFNDTNDAYTDPNLPWGDWENTLDLLALHGVNEVFLTIGTDAVYYELLQKYGYSAAELQQWIPDPAHQPWWVLQNLSGSRAPISPALLAKRAQLGRRIADRARELGITPVLPGYFGTVPIDFAQRNPGADVVAQGTWVGYERPAWLDPATPLFQRVAADYYAISRQLLGATSMYKMDPLHEGGVAGHIDVAAAATGIESAMRAAQPNATWVLLGWLDNPLPALLAGIADRSRVLVLASEADRYPIWDSGARWQALPYALGSIPTFGGRTILGGNATTLVDRWYTDMQMPGSNLRGVVIFPEAWNANPFMAELMTELPWSAARIDVKAWTESYVEGRYGTRDAHALAAWSILADNVYALAPDGDSEAQDSLFAAQPDLTARMASCCTGRMRYSLTALEQAWQELRAASPAIVQQDAYRFDLADLTRQVIVNRARGLLPLIRRAYDTADRSRFGALTNRWLALMDLADRVEGTHEAFLLGPRLAHAAANGDTPAEQSQLVHDALNLITTWGTRAGYDAGLGDYANRDWNCLTSTYYRQRWSLYFASLAQALGGQAPMAVDWYDVGEAFANADHSACARTASGDIVQLAQQAQALLDVGPEASSVPPGWNAFTENDAIFSDAAGPFTIDSAGADLWANVNQFGTIYHRTALREGGTATVRVLSLRSEGARPWARAGLMVANDVTARHPGGFANVAVTPGQGCVFSSAQSAGAGLLQQSRFAAFHAPVYVRMQRIGSVYVGSCSADGTNWTVVGSALAGHAGDAADVGMFATAANAGGSDRAVATFDEWTLDTGSGTDGSALAVEFLHAGFGHYFITIDPEEAAKLDAGFFPGWVRTGEAFKVYAHGDAQRMPVCRFFTTAFPPSSSHFYAPRGFGCEAALVNDDWRFEGDVFFATLPDAGGSCGPGEVPIYRLYNNGQGGAPNHRFTTSATVRAQTLAQGYIAEGSGSGVGMCAPQ